MPGWFTVSPYSEVTGISGRVTPDGGVTLFATVLDGRTFRIADLGPGGSSSDRTWTPDAGPTALYTVAPLSRDRAFVGGQTFGSGFYFAQLEGEGSSAARVRPGGPVALPYVLASGALSSTRAYFAGYNNTMFTWDGQGYLPISGPGPATSHFVGLCAFGTDHVLAVDTSARVWRYTGTRLADGGTTAELWVDLMSATSAPLRALAATAPDDVWVVGDNNSVLHFGE
ncbi:MAG: hypothetical protein H6Q89_4000 [Myxococcaceae bacterium]|nr:hypothetical protein [Myxococcaceae bacterium]